MNAQRLTKGEAAAIIDAHEIEQLWNNEEEASMLEENNPELYEAYKTLRMIAKGE